ncbi:MAG: AAA family ATPase, partial [Candidatus Helarchaeota archaeon]
MSDKNSENKEFEIKRITTPQGDVPTVDSMMEALNLIVSRINALSRDFNERLKYSGASIEAAEFIEQNLSDTNRKIYELKKSLTTNTEHIDEINKNLKNLEDVVSNLERMTKNILNNDYAPQSKSYEDILEIKELTISLRDTVSKLQKSIGEEFIELGMLYWEHNYTEISENLEDIVAYEPEKAKIMSYFKILNLPKPVINIDAKILLFGPSGIGKSSLIRAIAKDQKIKIIELNLPLIISLKPSKQVENLNNLFHYLRFKEGFKPCVLLLDNFGIIHKIQKDSLFLPLIETLILELSRIHLTKDRILVVAILNGAEYLEKRLLDQFNEKIEMNLPDQVSRALILRKLLNEVNLEIDLDLDEISSKLAEPELTDGFSRKDLKEIFNIAKLHAFTEGRPLLNENDLVKAIQTFKERKTFQISSELGGKAQDKTATGKKIQHLEEELQNVKMMLSYSTRMLKHALRLA